MNSIYLSRCRKVQLKAGNEQQTDAVLAAFQKNLECLGFVMSQNLMDRVATLDDDALASFYRHLVKDLRAMVGAHREFKPLYPNFPDQVWDMPEVLLYFNALRHYLTNKLPVFAKQERPTLAEPVELRIIDLGDKEDFEKIFTRLVGAKTSLSVTDKEDVKWFVAQYGQDIVRLMPSEIPSKENLAIFGAALVKQDATAALEILSRHIKTATDVLRLMVAMFEGDVSLAAPVKFGAIKRSARRTFLSWLERTGNAVEDMLRWKPRWIRAGERLHPGDYVEEFPKTYAAFKALRNDEQVPTFNGRLEPMLLSPESGEALALLATRPGDLARRLDHLLRISPDTEAVLRTFRAGAAKVSTPVLLQMLAHFSVRDNPPELRVFFPKGDTAKAHGEVNTLPKLKEGIAAQVSAICEEALVARFSLLPALGTCWIDERLRKYMVPLAQRSAAKALRTITRGSRLPLPNTRVLRFFIWWKNGSHRTDIDLSAALFDAEERYVDVLSYYNLKNFGGCHSGDIVDAPQGAAEFIDVELDLLRKHKVRYIMMMINSYTRQPYCDLPECFAGWMARQKPGSGEVFEARTVVDKLDVASNVQICIPAVFDLMENEVIWADMGLSHHPSFQNNVRTNLSSATVMLRSLTRLAKPDLYTLFSLHVRARGELTANGEPVETVFGVDEGITPYDIDRIRAEFL